MAAAWPGKCDVNGFDYDVTFRLPPADHIDDDTVRLLEPALQSVISITMSCSTCWECRCGDFQKLAHETVRKDIEIDDKDKLLTESRCLAGKQQQVITEHWNLTVQDFSTFLSTLNSTLNSTLSTLKTSMTELQTLKNQQEQLNDKLSTQKKINEDKDILISTLTQRNNELEEKRHTLTQQFIFTDCKHNYSYIYYR